MIVIIWLVIIAISIFLDRPYNIATMLMLSVSIIYWKFL